MKQKSLSWNYEERRCFRFPFTLKFPFEIVSYQYHQKLCKQRARGQTWTRFIVKWDRKQVRMAFSLALPSFVMKDFQSSNYKSKLKFFCESAFEGAAILPFKAFPQPDSWRGRGKGDFLCFIRWAEKDSQLQRIRQHGCPTLKRGKNELVNSSDRWIYFSPYPTAMVKHRRQK